MQKIKTHIVIYTQNPSNEQVTMSAANADNSSENIDTTANTPSNVGEQPTKFFRTAGRSIGKFGKTRGYAGGGFESAYVEGVVRDLYTTVGKGGTTWFLNIELDITASSGGKPDEKFVFPINLYPNSSDPTNVVHVTRACVKTDPPAVEQNAQAGNSTTDKKSNIDSKDSKKQWRPRVHNDDEPMAQFLTSTFIKVNMQQNFQSMVADGLAVPAERLPENRAKLVYNVNILDLPKNNNICYDFSPMIGKTIRCNKFEPIISTSLVPVDNLDGLGPEEENGKKINRISNECKDICVVERQNIKVEYKNNPLDTLFLSLDPNSIANGDDIQNTNIATAITQNNSEALDSIKRGFIANLIRNVDQTVYNKHHPVAEVNASDGTKLPPTPVAKVKWTFLTQKLQDPSIPVDNKIEIIKKELTLNDNFFYNACIVTGFGQFHDGRQLLKNIMDDNDSRCQQVLNFWTPIAASELAVSNKTSNKTPDHVFIQLVHSAVIPQTVLNLLKNPDFKTIEHRSFEEVVDMCEMTTPENPDVPEDETSCSTVCVPAKTVHEQLGCPPATALKHLLPFLDISTYQLLVSIKPDEMSLFNATMADITFDFYRIILDVCNSDSKLYREDPLISTTTRFNHYVENNIIKPAHMLLPISQKVLAELGVFSSTDDGFSCKIRFSNDDVAPVSEYKPYSQYKAAPTQEHQVKNASFTNPNNKIAFAGFKKHKFAPVKGDYQNLVDDAEEMGGEVKLALLFVSEEAKEAASDIWKERPYAHYNDDEKKETLVFVKDKMQCSKTLDLFKDATHVLLYAYYAPHTEDVHEQVVSESEGPQHDKSTKTKPTKRKKAM